LALSFSPEADGGNEVDQLAELAGFQLGAGEALVQDAFQARVVGSMAIQRVVDALADVGLLGLVADGLPACRFRHPEDVGHGVEVAVFQHARGRIWVSSGNVEVMAGVGRTRP
jgi:hypothetical protein